uniref:Uncharacterized protein n=2 Tax=Rhodococcus sp. NS1 TaxID=402236 RepID=Q06G82_9NOCA|nr:hypothetical protein PNSL1.101 [Rhodococcus sp. NS1]
MLKPSGDPMIARVHVSVAPLMTRGSLGFVIVAVIDELSLVSVTMGGSTVESALATAGMVSSGTIGVIAATTNRFMQFFVSRPGSMWMALRR